MYLFIDTETTGKYHFDKPSDHPDQPKIVEIAALLTDEHGKEWGSLNVLIDNGCSIPEEVTAIHGITEEDCAKYGIQHIEALDIVCQMARHSEPSFVTIIGHNIAFDMKMIRSQMGKYNFLDQEISNQATYCTMMKSTNVCKIPKEKGNGYKWPTLAQAYRVLVGKEMVGAHRAMADVLACKEVFFKLKELGL